MHREFSPQETDARPDDFERVAYPARPHPADPAEYRAWLRRLCGLDDGDRQQREDDVADDRVERMRDARDV